MNTSNNSVNISSNGPAPGPPPYPQNSLSHKVISSIAILILIILTLFGNGLVISAFYTFKRIRKSVTNWFILSLAVSDMMVAFITEPIWLAGEITTWMYPPEINVLTFALVWTMIDIVCAISSISNLMFISIDRYFAIKHPLMHHTKMTTGTCKWIILATWLHAIGTSCLFLIDQKWKYLVIFLFGFVVPLLIILFCYGGILGVVVTRSRLSANRHGRRLSNEFKTAKSLSVVTGAFIVCWLPFFLTSLPYHYCDSCKKDIDNIPAITSAVKWLHYLNSCLNPIIYAFLNPTFKLAFRNLIRRMCGKGYINSPDTEVSFMSFRSRRDNNSLTRDNSRKNKMENHMPNGILSSHKKPLLPKQEEQKMNGTVSHDSISDDGSVERGIETPEDKRSLTDHLCPTTPPPSYDDCYQLQTASNNNTSKTAGSNNNVFSSAEDGCALGLPEPCVKPRERTVSFLEEVEVCGEKASEKKATDVEDGPAFEGHFSTYHDKENNQTYLLVDGVTVPESEIRTSDV